MKCPKCSYLGFETGDRCKNCGYDFSLIPEPSSLDEPAASLSDVSLRSSTAEGPVLDDLPLFTPLFPTAFGGDSDEPLIKLPATPRPPLAVRRTPDTPRLRTTPRPRPRVEPDPSLDFTIEIEGPLAPSASLTPDPSILADRSIGVWAEAEQRAPVIARAARPVSAPAEVSHPGARMTAAAIDQVMLLGIDVAVLYFTLRMTGLTWAEWSMLPAVPFVAFLLLVKLAYFCAFTAVGGQTIGKMAARIRVVAADERPLAGAVALKRTLAATASTLLLGAGFIPALFGADRRAVHDRLTRTRVIALPSA